MTETKYLFIFVYISYSIIPCCITDQSLWSYLAFNLYPLNSIYYHLIMLQVFQISRSESTSLIIIIINAGNHNLNTAIKCKLTKQLQCSEEKCYRNTEQLSDLNAIILSFHLQTHFFLSIPPFLP